MPTIKPIRYSKNELNGQWHHVLYGQAPGGEQVPILEPENSPELDPRYPTSLERFIESPEPENYNGVGLTIANLSCMQHDQRPGYGGIATILSVRGLPHQGLHDHSNRPFPLYKHALMAVDRDIPARALYDSIIRLTCQAIGWRQVWNLIRDQRPLGLIDQWYEGYCKIPYEQEAKRLESLLNYVQSFDPFPDLRASQPAFQFVMETPRKFSKIYIHYDHTLYYDELVAYAAHLAAGLYMSRTTELPWAVIEVGTRYYNVTEGLVIRFVDKKAPPPKDPGLNFDICKLPSPFPLGEVDHRVRLQQTMSLLFGATLKPVAHSGAIRVPGTGEFSDERATPRSAAHATVTLPDNLPSPPSALAVPSPLRIGENTILFQHPDAVLKDFSPADNGVSTVGQKTGRRETTGERLMYSKPQLPPSAAAGSSGISPLPLLTATATDAPGGPMVASPQAAWPPTHFSVGTLFRNVLLAIVAFGLCTAGASAALYLRHEQVSPPVTNGSGAGSGSLSAKDAEYLLNGFNKKLEAAVDEPFKSLPKQVADEVKKLQLNCKGQAACIQPVNRDVVREGTRKAPKGGGQKEETLPEGLRNGSISEKQGIRP